MKASVTPTEMLKLFRSPSSLAWMNSSMSGWSQRSTPICAPRRLPADSTVSQRAVEHAHVAHRPARRCCCVLPTQAPLRADAREVVAHAAAAAHGLGGLGQRGVDAGVAVVDLGDGVAHRLHEAVDQRGRQLGAGGRVDAPGRHEAALLRLQEARFPLRALRRRARPRPARAPRAGAPRRSMLLVALGVLLEQHLWLIGCSGKCGARRHGGGAPAVFLMRVMAGGMWSLR